jgi:hypothetical protein
VVIVHQRTELNGPTSIRTWIRRRHLLTQSIDALGGAGGKEVLERTRSEAISAISIHARSMPMIICFSVGHPDTAPSLMDTIARQRQTRSSDDPNCPHQKADVRAMMTGIRAGLFWMGVRMSFQ